ncbi:type I-C CRISPR-associated protein Cas8c/Csd1 [Phytomonospora sp. NPDC050363]|uniref:type I-C CRISPR-associated protein Cas8c/Csd1 n=1 Tax=Phytomonospora sp. NPDC050363 TaxID=3155642 RepID=UPI0033E073F2
MLLQRLIQFRAGEDDDQQIPFYATKPVRWVLDLNGDGSLASTELTELSGEGKAANRGIPRTVPSVTKTSGIAPAIATDTIEYVLGWVTDDPKVSVKPERVAACHEAFIALNQQWAHADPGGPAPAIAAFYTNATTTLVTQPDKWSRGDLVEILVDGRPAAATTSARTFWATVAATRKGSGRVGLCLVCARPGALLNTIPRQLPVRLVPGATQSASLISVNKSTHGFQQATGLGHTPICETCGLKVMDSLEALLGDGDHSTFGGDSRMIWWVPSGGDFDADVYAHPDDHLDEVHALIAAANKGQAATVEAADTAILERFCALTIGGNVARVMIRNWVDMPLTEVQHNLGRWFTDIAVPGQAPGAFTYPGLGRLALAAGRFGDGLATTTEGSARTGYARFDAKGADRPDGVYRGLLEAALYAKRLPSGLSRHILHRIRRDGRVDDLRAALVQLCVRRNDPRYRTEEHMSINTDLATSPGFIAGRLFASYEYLQWAASNPARKGTDDKPTRADGVNTTFTHKYFAGAMTNPQRALTAGARLAPAWLKNIQRHSPARSVWITRQLDELTDQLAHAGGAHRTAMAAQQHHFVLGYHHQRHARFAPKPDTDTSTNTAPEGPQQ